MREERMWEVTPGVGDEDGHGIMIEGNEKVDEGLLLKDS